MTKKRRIKEVVANAEDIVLISCLGDYGDCVVRPSRVPLFFGTPIMWSEELSRYLQIWLTFLGIGYGIRHESHISMVLVYNKMPKRIQIIITILTDVIMIICFMFFIPGAIRFVIDQNQILSSAMQLPMSIVYFVGPLGGVVYCIYALNEIIVEGKGLITGNIGSIHTEHEITHAMLRGDEELHEVIWEEEE